MFLMAADVHRTSSVGGFGDAHRPSYGCAALHAHSLLEFSDGELGIGLNLFAYKARLKMKNGKALVKNEGGLLSTKRIVPYIEKGK